MSKLDANPDLMAVKNGVLNLRTGELSDFNLGHYITRQLDVEHDLTAKCPLFEKFLQTTFDGDADLISYVQGILGYSMTPYVSRQEMYIFWGSAANGKSTLMNVIRDILGGYSVSLMRETLFDKVGNNTSPDLARLVSVRMAVVQEAESRQRLNAPRIKELTGGDTISVAQKFKNPFDLKPVCKIFMLCNQRPGMNASDEGLKRRLRLIPFENVVPPDQRDPDLEQKLNAEASGILNWLLEGVQAYYNKGIRVPEKVAEATKQYIQDNDSVSGFLDDEIIKDPNATIPVADLYEAYEQYCIDESLRAETKGGFGKNLTNLGFERTRKNSVRLWKNLRIKTNEDDMNRFACSSFRENVVLEGFRANHASEQG
ncbi:MAG: putative DNA primase/helicase [Alphaproteobacteria bacterium]|jgi:putative DNA primase/helicase